jgi:hypothetical protein
MAKSFARQPNPVGGTRAIQSQLSYLVTSAWSGQTACSPRMRWLVGALPSSDGRDLPGNL